MFENVISNTLKNKNKSLCWKILFFTIMIYLIMEYIKGIRSNYFYSIRSIICFYFYSIRSINFYGIRSNFFFLRNVKTNLFFSTKSKTNFFSFSKSKTNYFNKKTPPPRFVNGRPLR